MDTLDMFSLKGKTAVVTSGSGLQGRQITLARCQAGAKVVVASRNKEQNDKYVLELKEQGYNAVSEVLDQGDENSIKS